MIGEDRLCACPYQICRIFESFDRSTYRQYNCMLMVHTAHCTVTLLSYAGNSCLYTYIVMSVDIVVNILGSATIIATKLSG